MAHAATQLRASLRSWTWGEVLGHVNFPAHTVAGASTLAAEFYRTQAEQDFCGNDVEDLLVPSWAPARAEWLPHALLQELGFRARREEDHDEIVATLGVDPHVDDIHGPTLCLVLHNEGLKFKQGRLSLAHRAGDIFIFNDALAHSVRSAKGQAAFLGLMVPLQSTEEDLA